MRATRRQADYDQLGADSAGVVDVATYRDAGLRDSEVRWQHGLPFGTRQACRLHGGAEYLDVLIEEWRVHVELDERLGHDRGREIWRDMQRDNRSEVRGLRHLRYGWADMVDRPCEVAAEQAEVLRQQNWTGVLRLCRGCSPRSP